MFLVCLSVCLWHAISWKAQLDLPWWQLWQHHLIGHVSASGRLKEPTLKPNVCPPQSDLCSLAVKTAVTVFCYATLNMLI